MVKDPEEENEEQEQDDSRDAQSSEPTWRPRYPSKQEEDPDERTAV